MPGKRPPQTCRLCHAALAVRHGRCLACDEAHRRSTVGVCTRCQEQGNTVRDAIWAHGLCWRHFRQMRRNLTVEAVGYCGNPENRDDFHALVQGLIQAMTAVAAVYVRWVNTGTGDYRHPDIRVMQDLLRFAQASLRPRAYLYVLRRVNRNFPRGHGIPYPRDTDGNEAEEGQVYETTQASGSRSRRS